MASSYPLDSTITMTGTFSVSGTNTDPTTITLKVKSPAGTTTSYTYAAAEITKSTTGIYTKALQFTSTGLWYYKWYGTGTVAAVSADKPIEILASEF